MGFCLFEEVNMRKLRLFNKIRTLQVVLSLLIFALVVFTFPQSVHAQMRCENALSDNSESSQLSLLSLLQSAKGNVRPEQIAELTKNLESYLSQHKGERILIFTDATNPTLKKGEGPKAWTNFKRNVRPQTSGVITVMNVIKSEIEKFGVEVRFVTPEEFKFHYQIDYQDVVLAAPTKKELDRIINEKKNLAVHIMVEGSVGKAAKKYLAKRDVPYTTAYHTDFPQYVIGFIKFYSEKFLGQKFSAALMKWLEVPKRKEALSQLVLKDLAKFHKHSEGVMVPTKSMLDTLVEKGFPAEDLRQWSHGVDLQKFSFNAKPKTEWYEAKAKELGLISKNDKLKEPIMLFVGRVGDEKNIEFFLDLPVHGTKVVVGDGPLLPAMKEKYKDVLFFGRQPHSMVPEFMANAHVFPFPSLSETFGLVNLEAAATGTPVVTFDYLKEIIASPSVGRTVQLTGDRQTDLNNFANAVQEAVALNREGVRAYAEQWSWKKSIIEMLTYMHFLTPQDIQNLEAGRR